MFWIFFLLSRESSHLSLRKLETEEGKEIPSLSLPSDVLARETSPTDTVKLFTVRERENHRLLSLFHSHPFVYEWCKKEREEWKQEEKREMYKEAWSVIALHNWCCEWVRERRDSRKTLPPPSAVTKGFHYTERLDWETTVRDWEIAERREWRMNCNGWQEEKRVRFSHTILYLDRTRTQHNIEGFLSLIFFSPLLFVKRRREWRCDDGSDV